MKSDGAQACLASSFSLILHPFRASFILHPHPSAASSAQPAQPLTQGPEILAPLEIPRRPSQAAARPALICASPLGSRGICP